MSILEPIYRLTVYAADDETPMTPAAGAPHSSAFKVATAQGITGFQPYMGMPKGRGGRLDPLEKKTDTGEISIPLLDKRTGTTNLERWVTAFVGDGDGRDRMVGAKAYVEQSLDGGSSWESYYTGRLQDVMTDGRIWMTLRIRSMAVDQKHRIFGGMPHSDIDYAILPVLSPLGMTEAWAGVTTVPLMSAKAHDWDLGTYGSGTALELPRSQFGENKVNPFGNIITKAFYDVVMQDNQGIGHKISSRVRARVSGYGHFYLQPHLALYGLEAGGPFALGYPKMLGLYKDGKGHCRLSSVGLVPLQTPTGTLLTGDPNYSAPPSEGSSVTLDIVLTGPFTKDAPLILADIHPVQLWQDLLAGKFGRLKDGVTDTPWGDVSWEVPYDASAFSALISDPSIPNGDFLVDGEVLDMRKWVEEHICKPYNLAWVLDRDGQVVPKDLRLPTSLAGVQTLEQEDVLLASGSVPSWTHSRSGALARIRGIYYVSEQIPNDEVQDSEGKFPDIPPSKIRTIDMQLVLLDLEGVRLSEDEYEVDAKGLRAFMVDGDGGAQSIIKAETFLQKTMEEQKGPYVMGPMEITIPCRRTTVPTSIQEGDLILLDVDEIPDPTTHVRGGIRLARVLEVRDEGMQISLNLLDQGRNVVCNVPTVGTLSLASGKARTAISVPVTLNAQGEPCQLEYAITATSVGTIPASDSPLWTFEEMVKASRTVIIQGLSANSRIWVRARSMVQDATALKLPSAWVTSSGTDYVDTQSLSAPSGLTIGDLYSCTAEVSWTNTEDDLDVELWLSQGGDEQQASTLAAGATGYLFQGLAASTSYTAKVRYRDGWGGYSAFASAVFSTNTDVPLAPRVAGVAIVIGRKVSI